MGNNPDITLPLTIEGNPYTVNLRGVSSIRSAIVPEGFAAIPAGAFQDCIKLESVQFPSTLKEIGGSAFANCIALKSIQIPKGTERIQGNAFFGCTSLKEVSLPDSLVYLGRGVFDDTAFFDEKDNWKDNGLYSGNNLIAVKEDSERFAVSENTVCIADDAFIDCFVLTEVTIGGDRFGVLYNVTNLKTHILTELPNRICEYFQYYEYHIPTTLDSVVLKQGCMIENQWMVRKHFRRYRLR